MMELAWAAGFYDGEGHSRTQGRGGVMLSIAQIDTEVLHRFQRAVGGLGVVRGPYGTNANWKPLWYYSVTNFTEFQQILTLLYPYVSSIKRSQLVQTQMVAVKSKYKWQICAEKGHRITKDKRGGHYCAECYYTKVADR